ncbi:MAG: histidine kinase N-terminal 7TM domain-containing protein [Candidatus Komeilibacteria bacterium]
MSKILADPQLLGLAIVTLLNLALGLYVFLKDFRNVLNKIFLFLAISIVAWCIAIFCTIYFYEDVFLYDLSDKFTYIAGLLIAIGFYLFSIYYGYKNHKISSLIVIGYILFFAIFSYLALFSHLFVINTAKEGLITVIYRNQMSYAIYSLALISLFILGLVELWKKMKGGDGVYKQHFLTLIILVGFSIILSIFFDLSLSAFNNYSYSAVGPLSSVLFIFAIMRMINSSKE